MLTQRLLIDNLAYDKCTGVFTRRIAACGKVAVGDVAGSLDAYGYTVISVLSKRYKAHRLAWLYVFGEFPKNQIDHINGRKSDNRIDNLRDVLPQGNMYNKTNAHRTNKSGLLGVAARGSGFTAQISANKKRTFLGFFDSATSAHQAYLCAKQKLHAIPNYQSNSESAS